MAKPKIRILHNLFRSGGTLIGKCLGSMSDIILLSEIHPLGFNLPKPNWNPLAQAYYWHNLIDIDEMSAKKYDFIEAIKLIYMKCTEKSKQLVIRDWSLLDFISLPNPSYRLLLSEILSKDFTIVEFALVRHPINIWISKEKIADFQNITLDVFLHGYLEYVKKIHPFGFVRFEDFLRDPEKEMRTLCEKLQLPYDKDFILKWRDYNKITGDFHKESRGSRLNKITPLPQVPVDNDLLQQFRRRRYYWEAINLLDYSDIR